VVLAPITVENLPAAQSVQTDKPAELYLPGLQAAQVVGVVLVLYVPAGHIPAHVVAVEERLYVPSRQLEQIVSLPETTLYLFEGQDRVAL
jgi:hypothetical protein